MPVISVAVAAAAAALLAGAGEPVGPADAPAPKARGWTASAAAGVWAARLGGLDVLGGAARVTVANDVVPRGAPSTPLRLELGVELGRGSLTGGVAVAEVVPGVSLWWAPAPRVQVGAGLEYGVLLARRATTARWAAGDLGGLRVAVRWDAFSSDRALGFLEVAGAARTMSREGYDFASRGWSGSAVVLLGVSSPSPRDRSSAATP